MSWQPTSEPELWDLINESRERMSLEQRRLWDVVKIVPEKWSQDPWGNQGNGFWVIGVIGNRAIWYNDIERGFNQSTFTVFGVLQDYWTNQDKLEETIQHLINEIRDGYDSAGYSGPPRSIDTSC